MVTQKEARLSQRILKVLKHQAKGSGWFVKIHGGADQTAGIPDIIGCYKGRFVAFEVKLPGQELNLRTLQSVQIRRIAQAGGFPNIVTTAQEAIEVLWRLDKLIEGEE